MLLRMTTTFRLAVVFMLLGAAPVLAQSKQPAIPEESVFNFVWEADASLAAALTCFPSSAPKMQRQFDPITGVRTGSPAFEPDHRSRRIVFSRSRPVTPVCTRGFVSHGTHSPTGPAATRH